MSNLTLNQRQQRLTNVLLAGNLYKSHQINKSLVKLTELQNKFIRQNEIHHKEKMGMMNKANLIAEAQLSLQQNVEFKKHLKNIFFELNEEIEDLISSKKLTIIEKFFKSATLMGLLAGHQIDHKITDDLKEKKYISDTIKKLNRESEKIIKSFKKSDKEDLEEISNILTVDEEQEIDKLKKDKNYKKSDITKKLKSWYSEAVKVHNGIIHLGLFPESTVPSSEEIIKKIKTGKFFRYQCEAYNTVYSWDVPGKSYLEKFHSLEKRFGIEDLKKIFEDDDLFKNWIIEKFKAPEMLNEINFLKMKNFVKASKEFSKYLAPSAKSQKGLFGWKKIDLNKKYDEISKKYKKEIDHIRKYAKKAFDVGFSEASKDSKKIESKISNLKKDIEDEKVKTSKIIKKHPFVATILKNRTKEKDKQVRDQEIIDEEINKMFMESL